MSVSVDVSSYDVSNGNIVLKISFYGDSDSGEDFYIDVKNSDSPYYSEVVHSYLSGSASEELISYFTLGNFGRLFTGTEKTFRVRWRGYSGTTRVTLPMSYTPSSYTISERPTQQTQYVTYNGVTYGEAGCCVANATASCIEVLKMRTGNTVYPYSVGWIYGGAGDGVSEELQFDISFDFLKSKGSPPAQVLTNTVGMMSYPDVYYQPDAKTMYNQNASSKINYATPQRIGSWQKLTSDYSWNFESIFNAVQRENTTVIMTLNINGALDSAYSNGWVGAIQETARGGHSVIVLGWTVSNGKYYWVVQNSWTYTAGTPLGDNGIYYFPFDHFNYDAGGIWDFYELTRDESAPTMPNLPDNTGSPKLVSRTSNGLNLTCNVIASAASYEYRYRKEGTTTYATKVSSTNNVGITGLDYGCTYYLSVRFYKNGIWSPYSQESECTVLPDFPDIEKVYSTTSNNLIVKLKDDSMNGRFSYVEIWRRNAPWVDTNSNIDAKTVTSLSALSEWTGLPTGSKFAFSCVGKITINGSTLQSYYRSSDVVGTVGLFRPSYFSWDTTKVAGSPVNITASEWNKLTANISEMLSYANKNSVSFTTAVKGNVITAKIFNESRSAIYSGSGLNASVSIPYAYSGNTMTANHFNKLVESLNSVS